MTTRADLPRLAASLSVLGTELESKGQTAWDRLAGWERGPSRPPAEGVDEVCTCAHLQTSHYGDTGPCTLTVDGWACPCMAWEPGQPLGGNGEDSSREQRDDRRAALQLAEFAADLRVLDRLVQSVNRRLDMACPPDMRELRNRLTGEFDPETATDALAQGFCPNCWAAGVRYVPLSEVEATHPTGIGKVRRYQDRCRPCGDFRKAEGIDKPKEIVVGHAQIPPRRFSPEHVAELVKKAKAAANPKKGKKKKGKRAA